VTSVLGIEPVRVGSTVQQIVTTFWHAAALLLPRDGLVNLRAQRKSVEEIAAHYGVSKALTEWRLRSDHAR